MNGSIEEVSKWCRYYILEGKMVSWTRDQERYTLKMGYEGNRKRAVQKDRLAWAHEQRPCRPRVQRTGGPVWRESMFSIGFYGRFLCLTPDSPPTSLRTGWWIIHHCVSSAWYIIDAQQIFGDWENKCINPFLLNQKRFWHLGVCRLWTWS